jgi:nucleotide-binding universal stress UspA family protein
MHLLLATDGTLPVEAAVRHVERLHRAGDQVAVMTAINLPRRLLKQLEAIASSDADIGSVVDAAGPGFVGLGGGDRVAERLTRRSAGLPLDDVLERYHEQVAHTSTQPLLDALADAGIEAERVVRETQDRTAATIIDVCRERRVDLLLIGSTGRGRFEGRVGATGTKLVRDAPCDVLLIRVQQTR